MDLPNIRLRQLPDPRFIEVTHKEYLRAIAELTGGIKAKLRKNTLSTGHINYLIGAIRLLYAAHERKAAQYYLDWVRANYKRKGGQWDLKDVEDFVLYDLRKESQPTRDLAESQIGMSLVVGFVALCRGDPQTFNDCLAYARRVHQVYQKGKVERLRLPSLQSYAIQVVLQLLANPRGLGYNLSLEERAGLYQSLDSRVQQIIQQRVGRILRSACEAQGVDFQKAFPPPTSSTPQPTGTSPARVP